MGICCFYLPRSFHSNFLKEMTSTLIPSPCSSSGLAPISSKTGCLTQHQCIANESGMGKGTKPDQWKLCLNYFRGEISFALGITNLQRNKPCAVNSHHAPQGKSLPKKKAQESRFVSDCMVELLDPPNLKSSYLRTFQLYDPLQPAVLTYNLL